MKTLWLADDARHTIAELARRRRLRETGGGLLGYENHGTWVVEKALPPGPRARHERFRLVSDQAFLQHAVDRELAASNGTRYYLGDWHTHPLGPARPSARDTSTAAAIAARPTVGLSQPLVLIQATLPWGRSTRPDRLHAYYFDRKSRDLRALQIRLFVPAV
jgi:integrative and conjugative element protein (TIGR02256 family)